MKYVEFSTNVNKSFPILKYVPSTIPPISRTFGTLIGQALKILVNLRLLLRQVVPRLSSKLDLTVIFPEMCTILLIFLLNYQSK